MASFELGKEMEEKVFSSCHELEHRPFKNRLWLRLSANNVSSCNLFLPPPLFINYIGFISLPV